MTRLPWGWEDKTTSSLSPAALPELLRGCLSHLSPAHPCVHHPVFTRFGSPVPLASPPPPSTLRHLPAHHLLFCCPGLCPRNLPVLCPTFSPVLITGLLTSGHALLIIRYRGSIIRRGTSLGVRWLRLCASNAGGPGLIPGRGTRSHMPQLRPGAVK